MNLETKYGPPSGGTPVTAQVITYLRGVSPLAGVASSNHICSLMPLPLNFMPIVLHFHSQIFHSKKENDVEMRKLLYSLLAPSGNVDSQKV